MEEILKMLEKRMTQAEVDFDNACIGYEEFKRQRDRAVEEIAILDKLIDYAKEIK